MYYSWYYLFLYKPCNIYFKVSCHHSIKLQYGNNPSLAWSGNLPELHLTLPLAPSQNHRGGQQWLNYLSNSGNSLLLQQDKIGIAQMNKTVDFIKVLLRLLGRLLTRLLKKLPECQLHSFEMTLDILIQLGLQSAARYSEGNS